MADAKVCHISVSLDKCPKVFVHRDYSSGMTVKFSTKLPQELHGRFDADTFATVVTRLNEMYEKAEKVTCESVFENVIGFFTCYLAHLCITFQYDKYMKLIAAYLKEQNEKLFIPHGLFVTDPIKRGLRVIEITEISSVLDASTV